MNDIEPILKDRVRNVLVTVFPHPDDETMMAAGIIMKAKSLGYRTVVISLTAGGAGKIHVNARGKSLKEVRRAELARAASILGADEVIVGDFDDGKLKETRNSWIGWVEKQLECIRPGILVTYDPSGFYGHPDHIALSKWLLNYVRKNRSVQLVWVAVPHEYRNSGVLAGMSKVTQYMQEPTHVLDLGWRWYIKWLAARAHRSQNPGKGLPVPLWLFMAIKHYEWYHVLSNRANKSGYRFGYIDYQI